MDPEIYFDHPTDRARLSDLDRAIILGAAQAANVSEIHVTRTASTPEQQARAMYANCVANGPESQLRLYGPFGDQVVETFIECQKRGAGAVETITAMTATILQVGAPNVSHHCVADWTQLHIIDMSSSRIPRARHAGFEAALAADGRISRHFSPYTKPSDPAWHVEIPQVA
jgi:hypothetical protein